MQQYKTEWDKVIGGGTKKVPAEFKVSRGYLRLERFQGECGPWTTSWILTDSFRKKESIPSGQNVQDKDKNRGKNSANLRNGKQLLKSNADKRKCSSIRCCFLNLRALPMGLECQAQGGWIWSEMHWHATDHFHMRMSARNDKINWKAEFRTHFPIPSYKQWPQITGKARENKNLNKSIGYKTSKETNASNMTGII